jgi:outer membrane protein OmpA-like peptidoglycan-associated protein
VGGESLGRAAQWLIGATLAGAAGATCAEPKASVSYPEVVSAGEAGIQPASDAADDAATDDAATDESAADAYANMRVQPFYGAAVLIPNTITFAPGSTKIPEASRDLLRGLLAWAVAMRNQPGAPSDNIVEVDGYADASEGPAGHRLSLERAQHVRAALIELGMDPGSLVAVGHGAENAIDAGAVGRKVNPRVSLSRKASRPDGG